MCMYVYFLCIGTVLLANNCCTISFVQFRNSESLNHRQSLAKKKLRCFVLAKKDFFKKFSSCFIALFGVVIVVVIVSPEDFHQHHKSVCRKLLMMLLSRFQTPVRILLHLTVDFSFASTKYLVKKSFCLELGIALVNICATNFDTALDGRTAVFSSLWVVVFFL